VVAFFFGLVAQQFKLPPLVGLLISDLVFKSMGQEGGEALTTTANLEVTLLLFLIQTPSPDENRDQQTDRRNAIYNCHARCFIVYPFLPI